MSDPIAEFLGTATPAPTGLDMARQEIEKDMEALKAESISASAMSDYEYVRVKMRFSIEKFGELIPSLVRVTEASESPQQYSAAAAFFKVFGDLNGALLDTAVKADRVGKGAGRGKALPAPTKNEPISPDGSQASTPGDLHDPNDFLSELLMNKKKEVVVVEVKGS